MGLHELPDDGVDFQRSDEGVPGHRPASNGLRAGLQVRPGFRDVAGELSPVRVGAGFGRIFLTGFRMKKPVGLLQLHFQVMQPGPNRIALVGHLWRPSLKESVPLYTSLDPAAARERTTPATRSIAARRRPRRRARAPLTQSATSSRRATPRRRRAPRGSQPRGWSRSRPWK